MKAVVAAFNQEKALVGAFSVLTNLRMELFQALISTVSTVSSRNYEDNETPAPVLTLIPTLQLERKGWAKR